MSIVSHEQWDHMIDKLDYLCSPELLQAHKPPFRPFAAALKIHFTYKLPLRCPRGQPEDLTFCHNVYHTLFVMCPVLHVRCHMSGVTCHLSHFGSQWSVCYQQSLPCLVLRLFCNKKRVDTQYYLSWLEVIQFWSLKQAN